MLSRFPPSNDNSSSSYRWNTSEDEGRQKNDKNSKSVSSFLPTEKHSRDLRAYKIKKITPVKREMTTSIFLAFTEPKNRYIQQHKKDLRL